MLTMGIPSNAVIALMLAAGLEGIREELDPGAPNLVNAYTLSAAERAERAERIRQIREADRQRQSEAAEARRLLLA